MSFNEDAHYDALFERYNREPRVAFHCDCCGNEVYEGNDYYETDLGDRFCDDCISMKEAECDEDM